MDGLQSWGEGRVLTTDSLRLGDHDGRRRVQSQRREQRGTEELRALAELGAALGVCG